jgi:hypothetical protein
VSETWAKRIITALDQARAPLDDDELAALLNANQRQTINIAARKLASEGRVRREAGPAGKIVNMLTAAEAPPAPDTVRDLDPAVPSVLRVPASPLLLTEDQVKMAAQSYLQREGWSVTIAWGRSDGVDIEAHRRNEQLYLEARGEASNPAQQASYFAGALGELVQRMRDPSAGYGLALPDNTQYRSQVQRLSPLAWERFSMVVIFVSRDWEVSEVVTAPL